MITIEPRRQVGTGGMEDWLTTISLSVQFRIITEAGEASSANNSIRYCFHCSELVATRRSRDNSCRLRGFANHQISPEGLTVTPKKQRLPSTFYTHQARDPQRRLVSLPPRYHDLSSEAPDSEDR